MKYYFVLSEEVLGLCANVKHFKWSYGIDALPTTKEAYDACAIRLKLSVGDFGNIEQEKDRGKYHYFSGQPDADSLYYERPFLFNRKLRLKVEGLLSDQPQVCVNRPYYRFIKHRFMNLHSVGYILTDIASLLMLRHGYAPLHCSAFRQGDSTVVVFAPPNTGKTLSTMMACMEYGADFLAEDLAITDGKTLFSVPWTSTFRYYTRVDAGRWTRLVNTLTQKIPVLELIPLTNAKPISAYVDEEHLLSRSDITHVVILERGGTSVHSITPEKALRKIANLNRYEFNYCKAPTLVAYEFFNPELGIDEASKREKSILSNMINIAREVRVVRTNDALEYAPLILKAVG